MKRTLDRWVVAALLAAAAVATPSIAVAAGDGACPSGVVALTFDDGPSPIYTPRILDALAARGVSATFFVTGVRVVSSPELVARAAAEGHLIANHGFSHRLLTRLPAPAIMTELLDTVAAVQAAGAEIAPVVRPPGGARSTTSDLVASELGLSTVLWSIDPGDWTGVGGSTIATRVLRRLHPGANILLHDGLRTSGSTLAALPAIIDGLRARGYCTGVLDDSGAVVRERVELPPDPGPECVGPHPCDRIGHVDAAAQWFLMDDLASDAGAAPFHFGDPGDVPLMGDWDCDGVDTPGVHRPSTATVHLRSSNTPGPADRSFTFGDPGDVVLAGDWDGDGCDTLAIFRRAEARMYLSNHLGPGTAEVFYTFGNPGDVPFAGDFDGDGRDDLGLHRPSTGLVYYRLAHGAGPADVQFTYGNPGDRIVAGDWDGDGVATPAAFRTSTRAWYVKLANRPGPADHTIRFQLPAHAPQVVAGFFGPAR